MKKKIDNLKSTNPKEYWKIINTGIKQNNPDIFFKTMNAGTQDDDLIHELDHINEIDYNKGNTKLPRGKIEKAIQNIFKNEKFSGEDKIVNEYLKHSTNSISDIYVKLGNAK
jgi:hypothetical protein